MPKRKYVDKDDYDKLCKKLRRIEEELCKKRRRRTRVLSSTSVSSSDEEQRNTRRSRCDDRPQSLRSFTRNTANPVPGSSRENTRQIHERNNTAPPPVAPPPAASPPATSPPAAPSQAAPVRPDAPVSVPPPAAIPVDGAADERQDAPSAANVAPDRPPMLIVPANGEAPDIIGDSDDVTPELDADIIEILGIDPTKSEKFGKDIQKDVAVRFEHTATVGLSKDDRKEITTKYFIPENCKLIGAPTLNPEVKAALSESVIKRDSVIESKQKLMASAISSLGEAITLVLSSKDKNTELLRLLMDTGKTLCDCQYHETNVRRNFITFAVKKDMKESLQNTKIDTFLFGSNLAETLRTAKAINKQGAELKFTSAPKPSTSKTNLLSTSKNWKNQFRANAARTQVTVKPTMPKTMPPPASRDSRGSSYKRSQAHRANQSRR